MFGAALRAELGRAVPGSFLAWLLFAASMAAWLLLIAAPPKLIVPVLCASGMIDWASVPAGMALVVAINPLPQLLMASTLMLCAMMLPFAHAPLIQMRARGGASEAAAITLFLAGFIAVWLIAILAITAIAVLLRFAVNGNDMLVWLTGLTIAALWQVSPIKAHCLRRSRRAYASDLQFNAHALAMGAATAAACVGSCWALMLLSVLADEMHLLIMAGVMLLMILDRRTCLISRDMRKARVFARSC